MCLAIPSKVISVNGDTALVSAGGSEYEASIQLLDEVNPGDYVLLHTGFAIQKISEEEALETFKILKELDALEDQIDAEEKNQ
ncbi:MAG: HypC/HybG/HupF family hydrogenase formation chaperone [Bacteroidales bacterium]|jgi:hydrogenase expression/formation protein HypC|nr:HypC/HybG/HupF family hydrogenase formation chaperone [Bacteroidales bacterium]MDD4213563.1 HypC/HybG/HupF family hydrogenase formation chaperone [Bacteroidales bacterium]